MKHTTLQSILLIIVSTSSLLKSCDIIKLKEQLKAQDTEHKAELDYLKMQCNQLVRSCNNGSK